MISTSTGVSTIFKLWNTLNSIFGNTWNHRGPRPISWLHPTSHLWWILTFYGSSWNHQRTPIDHLWRRMVPWLQTHPPPHSSLSEWLVHISHSRRETPELEWSVLHCHQRMMEHWVQCCWNSSVKMIVHTMVIQQSVYFSSVHFATSN